MIILKSIVLEVYVVNRKVVNLCWNVEIDVLFDLYFVIEFYLVL